MHPPKALPPSKDEIIKDTHTGGEFWDPLRILPTTPTLGLGPCRVLV